MNTARKNVVKVSIWTKPPKYWPEGGASGPPRNASARPTTVIAGSTPRDCPRGRRPSATSTTQAVIVTITSGRTGVSVSRNAVT